MKIPQLIFTSFLLLSSVFYVPTVAAETSRDYSAEVTAIENNFQSALALHHEEKYLDASELISDTYFDIFEGIEVQIAMRSDSLKTQLESEFSELRSAISKPQEREFIVAKADSLAKRIQAAVFQLKEDESWWDKFLSSFLIILREGFEAILIVGAMTAFLIKTKSRDLLYLVKNSTLTAIGLSLVLAVLFRFVFHVTAAQQELIEGITMILACGVLFVVGHWLISQAESNHWMKYVKSQLNDAVSSKSKRAIWMTCFLAVFREGAETVLFYQALWASSGPTTKSSIVSGFFVGSFVLLILFFVYKKTALKIPMKPFFRVTSALLYFLSITIAGKAIIELQAGGYLSVNRIEGLSALPWLGFYPTIENILLQGFLVVGLLGSLTWVYGKSYRDKKIARDTPEIRTSMEEVLQ